MTQGTARAATADRHPGTLHAAAISGAAENKARRRRDAFTIADGNGARNKIAGTRYSGPHGTARANDSAPNTMDPMKTANAATA